MQSTQHDGKEAKLSANRLCIYTSEICPIGFLQKFKGNSEKVPYKIRTIHERSDANWPVVVSVMHTGING